MLQSHQNEWAMKFKCQKQDCFICCCCIVVVFFLLLFFLGGGGGGGEGVGRFCSFFFLWFFFSFSLIFSPFFFLFFFLAYIVLFVFQFQTHVAKFSACPPASSLHPWYFECWIIVLRRGYCNISVRAQELCESQFNSVKKNFNHPTRGNYAVVIAGS